MALTSDNPFLLDSIDETLPVISYEKKKANEQKLNFSAFANWDVKSFDSPIGQITNLASNMYSMLPMFKEDSEEYKELQKRIKIMRMFQGNAINFGRRLEQSKAKKWVNL